ncbi:MAG: recombinase family protein [Marinomonas sp.]
MAKIGYIRVSTDEQNTDLQALALKEANCDKIYSDSGESGSKKTRPGLTEALKTLQTGDTLTVWKLDRLGRSQLDLLQLLDELQTRSIAFESITEGIDTNTPAGRMVFSMIAAMAQLERENLRERTKAGLKAAKKRGVRLGRPPAMSEEQISHAKNLLASGMRKADIARNMGIAYTTLRRSLKP